MAVIELINPSTHSPQTPLFPMSAVAVTPSDTDTFSAPVTVYVGVTGNVSVVPAGGQAAATFSGVPAGSVIPVLVGQVRATGTTASGLVALY